MDPLSVHAMTQNTTGTNRGLLDYNFSFSSLTKQREPFDLSIFSASPSSISMAPSTGLIKPNDDRDDDFGDFESGPAISFVSPRHTNDDHDDDFGDFESVPAISFVSPSIIKTPDPSSSNPTHDLHGLSSGILDSFTAPSNGGYIMSESIDTFNHFTAVNSISTSSSSSSSLWLKKESNDLDVSKVKSRSLDSDIFNKDVSSNLFDNFASTNAHSSSETVDIFSDFITSSSSFQVKKENTYLDASLTNSADEYFDIHRKNISPENSFDNFTSKSVHFTGANVDISNEPSASIDSSFSLQLKKESKVHDALKAKTRDMDSDLDTLKHSSENIFDNFTLPSKRTIPSDGGNFGDFPSVESKVDSDDLFYNFAPTDPSVKVTAVVVTPNITVKSVQEDLFSKFSDSSALQSIKEGTHFGGNNGMSLKTNLEDDWGDFVEFSDSAATCTTQRSIDDIEPNQNNVWGTSTPFVKTEKFNGNAREDMFTGLDPFDRDRSSYLKANNTLLPGNMDSDYLKDKAKTALKTSELQRTLSENLTREVRIGSLIETSAPIPLSLFGEEETEVEDCRDEPLQTVTQHFQGRSRRKSHSIAALPSGGTVNFSEMIASLYPIHGPESCENNVFQVNNVNKEHEPNAEMKKRKCVLDGVEDNCNSSEGGLRSHSLEEDLFNLNLAASSNQGRMQDDSCAKEEGNEEATSALLLSRASVDDQHSFVKAWADVLAVCASELQHASNVWSQAQNESVQLDFLANHEAKRYFAAIGQIYVVSLILASSLNICKSWLRVGSKESESLLASLRSCKETWVQTNLKEAVQFSLDALKDSLPSSLVSWKGIEDFPSTAQTMCTQSPGYSHLICRLSLLPLLPFTDTGLSTIQWSGSAYFLPLANVWAQYVSNEAPSVPSLQL